MEMMIQVENLTKSFHVGDEKITVLKDLSFQVPVGSMVALRGPSGSGKTTLLNILGLVDSPTSGSVKINDILVNDKKVERSTLRRSLIGYIFQQYHLLPQFSALDNVVMPLIPVKVDFDVYERAKQLLTSVGLGSRINHVPSKLSGGEQQRVAIARALINSPKVLVCDEPTGNLDSATRDSILDLLSVLHDQGLTIIMATHDPEVAERCTIQLEIRDGHLSCI